MTPVEPSPIEALLEHTGFVRNLARAALGRDDLSEDVAQDAWVAALERGPREPAAARGWFYRVVRNRVASLGRRESLRRRHLQEAPEAPPVPSPDEILVREESRRRLVDALVRLDAPYREPLVLRYYEDLRPREIARHLGLPVETVRTRLKRGIAQLRAALDERYGSRRAWVLGVLPLTRLPLGGSGAAASGGAVVAWTAAALLVAGGALLLSPVLREREEAPSAESAVAPSRSAPSDVALLHGRPAADPEDGGLVAATASDDPSDRSAFATVRVVDSAGAPVADAEVRVVETRLGFAFDRVAVIGRTDEEGRLQVPRTARPEPAERIPSSVFALRVTHPADRDDLRDVAIEDWRPDDATVTLERGFVVAAEVVDRRGRPVPGATVHLEGPGRRLVIEADMGGRFRQTGLPPARWRCWVSIRDVRSERGERRSEETVLESGTQGARLEIDAEGCLLVRLPAFDARDDGQRQTRLRVTEYDSTLADGPDGFVSLHPVAADGTVWLYGVREPMRYALWWGPDAQSRHAYEPSVGAADGRVDLSLRKGRPLRLDVARPVGWSGWPVVHATARGLDFVSPVPLHGTCVFRGLPDVELVLRAAGRDDAGREVFGETRARPGTDSTMELSLR